MRFAGFFALMLYLGMKSASLYEAWASSMLDPIEVPDWRS
jgi:hypothetical protein